MVTFMHNGHMVRLSKCGANMLRDAVWVYWVNANQAWLVTWHDQPLALKNSLSELKDYLDHILPGGWT